MIPPVGAILASTTTVVCNFGDWMIIKQISLRLQTASLSFIPVAVYFDLFSILVKIGKPATSQQITDSRNEERSQVEKEQAPLCMSIL